MRAYPDIATLCALQIICFLLLTHLEPDFFKFHLYQTVSHIAILPMPFYMRDQRAYMVGILGPVSWLIL
jgi:hypothetical protein